MLWAWAKHRHPRKSLHWIRNRYWHRDKDRENFSTRESNGYSLIWHSDTPIKRFVKVRSNRSPYDGDWVYWSQRLGRSPLISSRVATLLKKQGGKCAYCHKFFTPEDQIEVDHIQPKSKGGKDTLDNLQLLHKCCHDLKTAKDGSLNKGCAHDKGCPTEEPYEGKPSRTVLKTSNCGDTIA